MEWLDAITNSINYIEDHLLEEIKIEDVCKEQMFSQYYFQKVFSLMTGITISEYIRNRRLYLAAVELVNGHNKIIDIAYKYGYDTPESFTKAFQRFHGVTPSALKGNAALIKAYLPLQIKIDVIGGQKMDYTLEVVKNFKIIGFERVFNFEDSYHEIPLFWKEIMDNYEKPLFLGKKPETDIEKAIVENEIGTFGLCVDNIKSNGQFHYVIGGLYKGGKIPEGMALYELPEMKWIKFKVTGPIPGALQSINTKVFKEFIPNNPQFNYQGLYNIEYYSSKGNPTDDDYESGIWIPVLNK